MNGVNPEYDNLSIITEIIKFCGGQQGHGNHMKVCFMNRTHEKTDQISLTVFF